MNWLIGYLTTGLVTLVIIVLADQLSNDTQPSVHSLLMVEVGEKRVLWSWRLAVNLFAPVLLAMFVLFVIFAWPIVFFWKGRDMWTQHTSSIREVFAVTRKDLVRQWDVAQIEEHERVIDPLGAVPDLPFGHLSAAWQQFRQALQPQDAIWSFSSNWSASWERATIREGYVVLRAGRIGPHVVTSSHEAPSAGCA